MGNVAVIEQPQRRSVLIDMASRYGMEAAAFEQTLRATVVPANTTREQFAAFLLVAKEHKLNPVLKEIYAFPTRAGGIQPIVGIDGWLNIINSHPQFDGMEFKDAFADGKLASVTCKIFRKDRAHPIEVTEYMTECSRKTEPWEKWPARMLRHKAAIQCARYAFGFSGIMDEDEYERMESVKTTTTLTAPPPPPATAPLEQVAKEIMGAAVEIGEPADDGVEDWATRLAEAESRAVQDEIFENEIEPAREHGGIGMNDYNRLIALLKDA